MWLSLRMSETTELISSENVAGCEDLIIEILLRLPVNPLIRFKLVSKQWFNLISDSKFSHSHVRRNANISPTGIFFYDSFLIFQSPEFVWLNKTKPDQVAPSLDFLSCLKVEGDEAKILQSCNGLFLYSFYCNIANVKRYTLCVCNPTTKQYRVVPLPKDTPTSEWFVCSLGLAFDPSISLHYKIISTQYYDPDRIFRVHIYSSEDQCWRFQLQYTDPRAYMLRMNSGDGIFWDGGVHWMGHHSFHFDIKSETLVERERPLVYGVLDNSLGTVRVCGVMDRHLYLLHRLRPREEDKVYVAELREGYSGWDIKYSFGVCDLTSEFPEIVTLKRNNGVDEAIYEFCALSVVEGRKEEDSALVLLIPGRVISYNFKHKTVSTLCDLPFKPERRYKHDVVEAYKFVETLASV